MRVRAVLIFAVLLIGLTALPSLGSNDILWPDQWSMEQIRAEQAWAKSTGKGITIAIVDSGINFNHPDLQGKSAGAWDCLEDPCRPTSENSDENGHGTAVGGVAAAVSNNGRGIGSVAPDAKLLSIKVFGAEGKTSSDIVERGIRKAAELGAHVINLSLGTAVVVGPLNTVALSDAMRYAYNEKGAALIASAGNSGFASSYTGNAFVYIVGSTGPKDEVAAHSDSFAGVDIHAPGGNPPDNSCSSAHCVLTTSKDGAYQTSVGTSLAAPHVSGVAALLRAQGLSAEAARNRMTSTADPIEGGHKRVNAARAVGANPDAPSTMPKGFEGGKTTTSGGGTGAKSGSSSSGSGGSGSAGATQSEQGGEIINHNPVTDDEPDSFALGEEEEGGGSSNTLLYVLIAAAVILLPGLGYMGYKLGAKPRG